MSIDVNVQNDLVIVTESSEDITVNVSNAAGVPGPAGVGVPVGGATGEVLKKFSNTNYDTYWAADASGLTSVGLSMPTAFTVSNTPLTSNGTIAVSGAGTAAQYIRGDGQLATFPSTSSGGSSVNYYLNGSINASVAGYKQLANTATIGGGTDFTLTGNGLIAQFLTDAGNPNRLEIPGGSWNFEMYFQVSSSGGSQKFYVELLKYNGTTFTSIASSSTVPEEITGGTSIDLYLTSLAVPTTSLLVTDRLAIRVYIVDNAGGRTVTLHTEDNTLCEIITTFAGGISALNGLTANTQYFATGTSGTDFAISSLSDTHTFNLPTASATNRGALSSTDWSSFSGKVGGSGVTGQVAYWNGTNSQTGSNNLFWDAANSRLGIGTNAPGYGLSIIGTTSLGTNTPQYSANHFIQGITDIPTLIIRTAIGAGSNIQEWYNGNSQRAVLNASGDLSAGRIRVTTNNLSFPPISFSANTQAGLYYSSGVGIVTNNTERMRIYDTTGNVVLQNGGTFSDGGQRLQVYGDAFVKGSGSTSATIALRVENSGGLLLMRVLNDGRLRFGNSPFMYPFSTVGTDVNIGGTNLSFNSTTTTQSTINGRFFFGGDPLTQVSDAQYNIYSDTRFFPTSGTATFADTYIRPTINQTGGANGITRGLYVNPTLTAAADWRSIEWSNNSGWGLYGSGSANNYLNGRLGIGTTTPSYNLDVWSASSAIIRVKNFSSGNASLLLDAATNNDISIIGLSRASQSNTYEIRGYHNQPALGGLTNALSIYQPGSTSHALVITIARNILVNSTIDAGFRLDVNGTARVSGAMTLGSTSSVAAFIPSGTALRVNQNNGTLYIDAGLDLAGTIIIRGTTLTLPNTSASNFSSNNVDAGSVAAGSGLKIAGQQVFNVKLSGDVLRFNDNTTYTNVGMYGNGYQISNSTIPINMTFNASALFELNTTTKGFLPPRMTTTQKNAIATPAAGLVVYDTDTNKLCCYNGTTWNDLF